MAGGHRTTSGRLVQALSALAPSVTRGRSALDVVRIASEGLASLGLGVLTLQLVDGELFVLFVSDDRGMRSALDRAPDRLFALRTRVEPGGAAFAILADGRNAYEPNFDPYLAFFGAKAARSLGAEAATAPSNAIVIPIFVRGLPWGLAVVSSPTLSQEEAPAVSLFGAHVASAIALADCTQRLVGIEEELIGRERLATIGELAATLAHEVRNPLGVLFNSIASLRRILQRDVDHKARASAQKLLGIFGEETERLDAIATDLLALARPTSLRKREARLENLLRGVAEIVPRLAEGAGVDVEVDLAPDLPVLMVDDRLLYQALFNLVINAAQAMPEGGTLTLRARLDFAEGGPYAVVEVHDTGTGIAPAHQSRVFEPFFTTKPTGTGLGLPLVKRVVDAHRGRIGLATSPAGTTFTIRLPLPTDDQSHVSLKREARSVPHLRVVGTAR